MPLFLLWFTICSQPCIVFMVLLIISSYTPKAFHMGTLDNSSVPIWNSGTWRDKAGGYGIQEPFGMKAVRRIEGDYYNIMGLPISRLCQVLKDFGVDL